MGNRQITLMKVLLLLSSLASLGVLASAAYRENFRGDWRGAQSRYKEFLSDTAQDEIARTSAESMPLQHQQLYLPELNAIDRCTTCHLGVENPAMTAAPEPLTTHSGTILNEHPVEKFGCTVCHGGEGRAVVKEAAHGWRTDGTPTPDVDVPLLRGDAVYTSCGKCHSELDLYGSEADLFAGADSSGRATLRPRITEASLAQSLPGAERLAKGKQLTATLGCLGCHQYRGRGGTLGPELTYVGDKTRHNFDFTRIRGEHTVEQWLYEHFKFPGEVSPGTVMPDMGLSHQQARDLAMYMMSLHRKTAPASHMPRPHTIRIASSAIAGDAGAASLHSVRGETLYKMFCSACHGPDGFGTTMRAEMWPTDADPWGRGWDVRSVVVEQRGAMDVIVPSLHHADTLATASDDYLRRIISGGRSGTKMPAWAEAGGLTDDEITLLVRFIRGWDKPMPELAGVSASVGDPRVGGALYRANCSTCHGVNGEGAIGNSLNSPSFLAAASDAFLRDTIVQGRPNTAMPAWREFNAQELSDLLAFLRQWQPSRSDIPATLALSDGPESRSVSAAIGQTLFAANCVMCHGDNGQGDLGPSLNTQSFLTVIPNEYLVETLIQGRPGTGMPGWRHQSSEDLASIVRFIRTWQKELSKPREWHEQVVARGDWDAGRHLFAGQCASCHGGDGEGATGPQLNNPNFLNLASDVMLREWISNGKDGTEMRAFRKGGHGVAELSERQIEDIIAFLRLLQRAGEGELTRVAKSPHGRPERGAVIYAESCVSCHGVRGEGASGPALSNPAFLRFASDGFLMATMALGRTGTEMRPVKRGPQSILNLSSDEVNDLVAYLRSWEHTPPFESGGITGIPHRFVVPWDIARGNQLFASNCAGCHGLEGKGSWAPELNNEGFLAAASDGFLQATIIRGRTGTAMRAFGVGTNGLVDLSPSDVDDIVAYMRHWSLQTPSPMTLPAARSLQIEAAPDDLAPNKGAANSPASQTTESSPLAAAGGQPAGEK